MTRFGFSAMLLILLVGLLPLPAAAADRLAVLDFELNDLTLRPGTPEELRRTASLQALLEESLRAKGYQTVPVEAAEQSRTSNSFGYLWEHADVAAALGRQAGADYVLVGRLHKPSFLFSYLMVRIIDTEAQDIVANLVVEIKGQQEKLTRRGVASLARQIDERLRPAAAANASGTDARL